MPFSITLRVRYAEIDLQGHAFNGHYLTWFDMAHTHALGEAVGRPYAELVRAGIDVVVSECGVRYLAPVHLDDELTVEVEFEPPTTSSVTSRLTILRDGETVTTGFLRHVCIDPQARVKRAWPEAIRAALEAAAGR
jgi:acyl-CoA thioester hydrolase